MPDDEPAGDTEASSAGQRYRIAIVGGTGPEGRGLATRFALAGHAVLLGSRDPARAVDAAEHVVEALAGREHGAVDGRSNADAVREAELIVLTVPYEGHRGTLAVLRDTLGPELEGRILVDAVVPVRFERGPRPIEVPHGSATEEAAALLPGARIAGAFHNLPAEVLLAPDEPLDADVLVTATDAETRQVVMALAASIAGVRPVDAGPLRYSRFVEGLTVLLIGLNGRYKAHSGVRITGLSAAGSATA